MQPGLHPQKANEIGDLSFQGRYSLPILAGLTFLPMLDNRDRPMRAWRSLIIGALALITIAEIGGFWQMLRRFAVGAHGKIWLVGALPWRPSVSPMLLVAANATVMIALCVVVVVTTRDKDNSVPALTG